MQVAVGKKLFRNLEVRVSKDLLRLPDGNSSNRWCAGCVESLVMCVVLRW